MENKLKFQLTAVILLMGAPLAYILYFIWNMEPTDDANLLLTCCVVHLILIVCLFPILIVLIDKAAKQLAISEFLKECNDKESK